MATIIIPLFGDDEEAPTKRDEEAEQKAQEQLEKLQEFWRQEIERRAPQPQIIPVTDK